VSSGVPAARRDLEQRDRSVCSHHHEAARVEADVGFGRLERFGGELDALGDDLVRRAPDRRAAHIGRA
jgi:hypothetical protein